MVRLDIDQVTDRLQCVHSQISQMHELKACKIYMFSDSLILTSDATGEPADTVDLLITAVRKILSAGLDKKLLFRGAIAYGEMICGDRVCVGTPLIRAVDMEKRLYFPIVVVPAAEALNSGISETLLGPEYSPTRTKSGLILAQQIFPTDIGRFRTEVNDLAFNAIRHGPDHAAQTLGEFSILLKEEQEIRSDSFRFIAKG